MSGNNVNFNQNTLQEELPIEKQISNILREIPTGKRSIENCQLISRWLLDVERVNVRPSHRIFEKIPSTVLLEVAQFITLQGYDTNELIFLQGETGVCYYIILVGSVDIYDADVAKMNRDLHMTYVDTKLRNELSHIPKEAISDPDCLSKQLAQVVIKSKLMTSLNAGNTFGEIALLTDKTTRTASAVASQITELITINKPLYDRTLKKYQNNSLDFEEKLKFLPNVDIFSDWGASRWNHIAYWLEEVEYPRGACILKEGTKGRWVGLIRSGNCRFTIKSPSESIHQGRPVDLSLVSEYNVIGEGSFLPCEQLRLDSVVAVTRVTLFILRENSFKRLTNLSKGTECMNKMQSIWNDRCAFRESRIRLCCPPKHSADMSFLEKLRLEGKVQLDTPLPKISIIPKFTDSPSSHKLSPRPPNSKSPRSPNGSVRKRKFLFGTPYVPITSLLVDSQPEKYWKKATLPSPKPLASPATRGMSAEEDDTGNDTQVPFGLPSYAEICKVLNANVTLKETAKLWNPITNRKKI